MITFITRAIVSGLFVVAGLLKLRDAELTLISIYQYQLLSWESAGVLAATLPWIEIAGGVGIWLPKLRLGGATLCLGLTVLFITALGSSVTRGLDVSCGCFGTSDLHVTALRRLGEDIVLLVLCGVLWRSELHRIRAQLQFEAGTA
jgi:putative oxidoreductase